MNPWIVPGALAVLFIAGYYMGRARAVASAGGDIRSLHSLPGYHGVYVALWCGLPCLAVATLWLAFGAAAIESLVWAGLPP
ncbi:MAG: phosphate ABC transporter permease family protein, partial [Geminicoccales bacterium]